MSLDKKDSYVGVVFVVDCWNIHWDKETNQISNDLNKKINKYIEEKRKCSNYLIIHCPHDCKRYYENYKNYLKKENDNEQYFKCVDKVDLEKKLKLLPFRFTCPNGLLSWFKEGWYKQHDLIKIHDDDKICLDANTIIKYLKDRKISNIFYVGYHLNLCILYSRDISAINMTNNGFNVNIVYDLCDTLFDSRYETNEIKSKIQAHQSMIKSIKNII